MAWQSGEDIFLATLQQFKDCSNSSAFLEHILGAFKPQLVSLYATSMTQLIREADESATPKSRLYYMLGCALIQAAPPPEQRLQILNEVWKVVTKLTDTTEYMEIVQVFVEYLLQHFASRETNVRLLICVSRCFVLTLFEFSIFEYP